MRLLPRINNLIPQLCILLLILLPNLCLNHQAGAEGYLKMQDRIFGVINVIPFVFMDTMQASRQYIWIGTSNIVVPGNKSTFPPPYNLKSRLHYYSKLFNSVEINQTFYKLPKPATFERWAGEVDDDFKFSVKLTRDITHHKGLQGNLEVVGDFLYAAERLGNKKGCLLLQFPGKITLDYFNEVEAILKRIEQEDAEQQWKKAVELRDVSWHTGETFELLNHYAASLVIQDMPRSKITDHLTQADFIYVRFHGPRGDYRDGYTDEFLQHKAHQAISWMKEGKQVYIYFNNTIGDAFENALALKRLIGRYAPGQNSGANE